jgi:hypothetical protein
MCTETINLTKSQRTYLKRIKKPKSFDTKSQNVKDSPNPNYEAPPEQPTPIPYPLLQVPSHKRDREDEFQSDQPTHKQPRQLSPSLSLPSDSDPRQSESPNLNEEDYFPTPTSTFDPKHQQQQENTQVNKKQKCQENAVLLTNIEPHLLQPNLPSDPAATPPNSLFQSLMIPTPNQMIPQSQTVEPTSDETVPDSPNQESTATETHDIAAPFESQPQAIPTTPKKRIRSSKNPHRDQRNKH